MIRTSMKSLITRFWMPFLLLLLVMPGIVMAQPIFSFQVNNLRAWDRTGNWMFNIDNPGVNNPPFIFPQDGLFNTFGTNPSIIPPNVFAEIYVGPGPLTTIGSPTENTGFGLDLSNPSNLQLVFTDPFR